ncbi:DUF7453 family protein [Lacipirellula limnantheis]|uniref:PEP-CTERM protein-sorting domain-containing protein n=1 Tax=Lacipirellula limnantheis TaxID=2528024 RepID=A0A517U396_9BACT|nr:choice-of-anchor tandem repeat NxxGxxAF-containing protein [Lacipirellula limnantheis]QDT75098.1 hypothetical protein I41_43070 [Lacipirellula limnantheis]
MSRSTQCALLVSTVLCCSSVQAAVNFRTVALSGQTAPDGSNAVLGTFSTPLLNNAGETTFQAKFATNIGTATTSTDTAIWFEHNSNLVLAAREGTQAPGAPLGATFSETFRLTGFNSASQFAFQGTLSSGAGGVSGTNNDGIWTNVGGAVSLLAREGALASGAGGASFGPLEFPRLNEAGEIVFKGSLAAGAAANSNEGIWAFRNGALELVAREGQPAPGAPAGTHFGGSNLDLTSFSPPLISDDGSILFAANFGVGAISTDRGIWSDREGSLDLVLRTGDQAPGTPAGTKIAFIIDSSRINGLGQLAGYWQLSGGDVIDNVNERGIWAEGNGPLELVARSGDPAPGTATGIVFDFLSPPSFNDAGKSAFYANLRGSNAELNSNNNEGIWTNRSGGLSLVMREGDQAPGLPAGAVFSFNLVSARPQHNNLGQIKFPGFLRSGAGGVTTDNDGALWVTDTSGALQLIVREGNSFTVAPGDVRTVMSIGPNGLGESSELNDDGTLAFVLKFTDGSQGVFTAKVGVPEPTSFAMTMLAIYSLVGICNRRTKRNLCNACSVGDAFGG